MGKVLHQIGPIQCARVGLFSKRLVKIKRSFKVADEVHHFAGEHDTEISIHFIGKHLENVPHPTLVDVDEL